MNIPVAATQAGIYQLKLHRLIERGNETKQAEAEVALVEAIIRAAWPHLPLPDAP